MISLNLKTWTALILLGAHLRAAAQVAVPHKMDQPSVEDNRVTVSISGRASGAFVRYFELFPLELSHDLRSWQLAALLTRTNASADVVRFTLDSALPESAYFRTPSNNLVTPLPPPSGPYPVGTFSRLLTDFSRTNQVRHTNQQFMVTFWYPTDQTAARLPSSYVDRAFAGPLSTWYGVSINTAFYGHALTNSALATNETQWPVLLYSPSANSHRRENVHLAEQLASQGFVVVAMDHRETFNAVFPNGSLVPGQTLNLSAITLSLLENALKDRVADARRVLDELATLNAQGSWQGRLDLEKIGALGFSLGGATAAQLCKLEPRVKAGAGFDGTFVDSSLLTNPLAKPFLFLRADQPDAQILGRPDDRKPVIQAMSRDGYFIQTIGTVHWSHSDVPLIADAATFARLYETSVHPASPPLRVAQLTSSLVVSFFRKYLHSVNDHLLGNSLAAFPDIVQTEFTTP